MSNVKLTFDRSEVIKVVEAAKAHPDLEPSYAWAMKDPQPLKEPHVKLVRDEGVYLLPKITTDAMPAFDKGETYRTVGLIAYAKEANPERDPHGAYEYGRRVFGGSDGVEDLPVSAFRHVEADGYGPVIITLTSNTIKVSA